MFRRFVVGHINKQSGVQQGILGVAYRLSREEQLEGSCKVALDQHLAWLMEAFAIPDIFERPFKGCVKYAFRIYKQRKTR